MDLSFTPQEEAFRNQVQAFLAEHLPSELSDKVANGERLSKADMEPVSYTHLTLPTKA